jgi:hypothetical protein
MQQATTIRATRRMNVRTGWGRMALSVVVVGAVVTGWMVRQPQPPAQPLTVPDVSKPYSRLFADEAASAPQVSEYTSLALNEDYLPLPVKANTKPHSLPLPRSRVFRDEVAGATVMQAVVDTTTQMMVDTDAPLRGPR